MKNTRRTLTFWERRPLLVKAFWLDIDYSPSFKFVIDCIVKQII